MPANGSSAPRAKTETHPPAFAAGKCALSRPLAGPSPFVSSLIQERSSMLLRPSQYSRHPPAAPAAQSGSPAPLRGPAIFPAPRR